MARRERALPRAARLKRAFTLIEMLVVIAIIMVLASLTFGIIQIVYGRTNATRAAAEIVSLRAALIMYINDHSAFPPDTGSWNETSFDPRSLHRYLGSAIMNPTTQTLREPYLPMRPKSLTDIDADGAGVYVDPWGNPYQFDAVHVILKDDKRVRIGRPYLPSRPEEKQTRGYKIVSFGPDGKSDPAYPFDWDTEHPDAKDDVRSW